MADRSKMASEQRTEQTLADLIILIFGRTCVRLRQVPPVIAEKYEQIVGGNGLFESTL